MELSLKLFKSAPVQAGFGAQHKRGLVQNQIIERVVYGNTLSIKWFSYCSKLDSYSYLDSLTYHLHSTQARYSCVSFSISETEHYSNEDNIDLILDCTILINITLVRKILLGFGLDLQKGQVPTVYKTYLKSLNNQIFSLSVYRNWRR